MNNQNQHNKSRLMNIVSGIPAVFCSLFIPSKKGRIIINSHFNTKFDFNSKYLFLYMVEKGYNIYYVINDDEYREQLSLKYGNHFIETNSFKGKIFALRSKLWFVSAFEMPVGGIFLKTFRTIVHLTHGSLIKNVGPLENNVGFIKKLYYKLCVKTNITYSIATSRFFVPSTSGYTLLPQDKIIVAGFPRNDALFNTEEPKPECMKDRTFKILYAPTWRMNERLKILPFRGMDFKELNKFLKSNKITLYVRLHPNDETGLDENMLGSNIKLFSGRDYDEIMDYLVYFDGLITDYSSIFYDFMLLNRPMMFITYDLEEYARDVGFAVDYKKIAIGYKPKTYEQFKKDLLDMKEIDSFKEKREKICLLCNEFKTDNCERLLKELNNLGVM